MSGSVRGRVGWDSGQPGLAGGVSAQGGGLGSVIFKVLSHPLIFCYCMTCVLHPWRRHGSLKGMWGVPGTFHRRITESQNQLGWKRPPEIFESTTMSARPWHSVPRPVFA